MSSQERATSSDRNESLEILSGTSFAQAGAGAVAVVLAIIGMTGTLPRYMMSISTIAVGAAFLVQGASIASQYSRLVAKASGDDFTEVALGGGIGAEATAGVAGIALGILALVGVVPMVLIPVATLAFSGALLLDSAVKVDLTAFAYRSRPGKLERVAGGAALIGGGIDVLVGIAAAALGILALVGVAPLVLSLIALLSIGATLLLSSGALGTKLAKASR